MHRGGGLKANQLPAQLLEYMRWLRRSELCARLAAQSQQLVDESIRSRIGYHVSAAPASDEILTMQCVLCDQKADEQHGLLFRLRGLRGDLTSDLRAELVQYGVCSHCFSLFQGNRRGIAQQINKMLRWDVRSVSPHSQ